MTKVNGLPTWKDTTKLQMQQSIYLKLCLENDDV